MKPNILLFFTDDPVYLLNIFPTLCDFLDLPTPESVEGKSFLPGITGIASLPRGPLYLAYADSIRGITDGHHKLIEYACGATQLFDSKLDPLEMNDLSGVDSSAPLLSDIRQTLRHLAEEWEDKNHPLGRHFWEKRKDL